MIVDLQSYFDGRGKLNNAITAIKCYSRDSKESSVFFGYVDGFKNKRTINIPIDPKDLLPILEKYVNNIDIQIADALLQARVIPNEVDCNADVWLEEKGWVKIHGDIIHYDGYSQKPMVRITEKQREQLVRYGNVCHRGFLKFGYRFNQISMIMFSSIEPLMLGKLFEL